MSQVHMTFIYSVVGLTYSDQPFQLQYGVASILKTNLVH